MTDERIEWWGAVTGRWDAQGKLHRREPFTYWACVRGGDPLGYVRAADLPEATERARERFGDGVELHRWDGVL